MFIEKEKYREIIGLIPILCVDIFAVKDGRLLLWKRMNNPLKGEWCVPWWRLMMGEKLKDGAKRKLKEELWIEYDWKLEKLWIYETIFDINSFGEDKPYHTVNNVYVITLDNEYPLSMDNQNEKLEFFEIKELVSFPDYINLLIRDYLKTYG